MDYSKCNFVSMSRLVTRLGRNPIMRVNVKSGNATLSRSVNVGMPFTLIGIDEVKKVIRVQMSETEGIKVHYDAKTCIFHLTKVVHELIIDGFNSAKSKVINLEKGDDGAWYGKF